MLVKKNKQRPGKDIDKQSIDEIIADIEKERKQKQQEEQKLRRHKSKQQNIQAKENAKEKKNRIQKNKKILKRIELSVLDLIPLKKPVDDGITGFELMNGTFLNVYKVEPSNFNSATDEELAEHIYVWEIHHKPNSNDEKIVAENMPVETAENVRFHRKKLNHTTNPLYREQLEKYIYEFTDELRDRECKEFYYVIFADSYEEMLKINSRFEGSMVSRGFAREITYEQKLQMFRRFFNPYNNVVRPKSNAN